MPHSDRDRQRDDTLRAVCEQWSATYSWDEMVDQIIDGLAKYGEICKDRMLSIGELRGSAFVFVNSHIEILRALQDGNHYGYLVGPHVWQKQMHRIESACEELERVFA